MRYMQTHPQRLEVAPTNLLLPATTLLPARMQDGQLALDEAISFRPD